MSEMSLFKMKRDYGVNDAGERAVFEAAMCKKVDEDGYTLMDLAYEVYKCQDKIATICERVNSLVDIVKLMRDIVDEKKSPKKRKK